MRQNDSLDPSEMLGKCYFDNSSKNNKIFHVRVLKYRSVRSHWPLEEELGDSLASQLLLVSEQ